MSNKEENHGLPPRCLHFECFAGISGDMTLGALVDLGVDKNALLKELSKLPLSGWKLEFHPDSRGGVCGVHPVVVMDDGSTDHIAEEHEHEHHGGHHSCGKPDEAATHEHGHHGHSGEHRHWKEIREMITGMEISGGAKEYALNIFTVLAEAEAEVHGVAVDEVGFHEVGAVDSIIDIVGTAICLDMLKPDRITSGPIELGGGMVRCAHGVLPVPAPAVLKLCHGLPCTTGGFDKEMTTPTGAAILRACVDEFVPGNESAFVQIDEGIGIGTRKMDKPNFLRVSLREECAGKSGPKPWLEETLFQIECNIDDMTGEDFGFLQEQLFKAGALDVAFIPCTMKKSRPGVIVQTLCGQEKRDAIRRTLFTQSTTIGFRETAVNRLALRREEDVIDTEDGAMRVKRVFLGDQFLRQKIEYDDRIKHEK
ncbi:MAG: nickel pincer cofactor biosynthesis protein LarC [Spirochaetaceae bacterium]|nr:nickel pincer cofactor biosynthesis protein LarC [Spirochaetaceae bacterium]